MTTAVRPAALADVPSAAGVLADAFGDDPLMSSIWPDPSDRTRALPGYFATSLRRFHLPAGGVSLAADSDGAVAAVAVWDPPGHWHRSLLSTIQAAPALVAAMRTRLPAALAISRALEAHYPTQPAWCLVNLGSTTTHRGRGHAARLVEQQLIHCDREAVPAWLVCTRESNITYYQRFGFTVTEKFQLPAGAKPPMWAMTREPR